MYPFWILFGIVIIGALVHWVFFSQPTREDATPKATTPSASTDTAEPPIQNHINRHRVTGEPPIQNPIKGPVVKPQRGGSDAFDWALAFGTAALAFRGFSALLNDEPEPKRRTMKAYKLDAPNKTTKQPKQVPKPNMGTTWYDDEFTPNKPHTLF